MTKITALIITLNEEGRIGACIDSLAGLADEVLVIDSFSQDKTKIIAESKGARVIEERFLGFGPQRNFGGVLAAHDLILAIDADERISAELRTSILEIREHGSNAAYSFNRLNFIGNRAIYGCGWYPDTHVRLYDRNVVQWNDRAVHENLIVKGTKRWISGDLLHYSYPDLADVKRKSSRYAALGAKVYEGRNVLWLCLMMLTSPVAKFVKMFILKKGYKEGYMGLMISYYRARETFLKYYWAA